MGESGCDLSGAGIGYYCGDVVESIDLMGDRCYGCAWGAFGYCIGAVEREADASAVADAGDLTVACVC